MTAAPPIARRSLPDLGQPDLSSCEREPIHLVGAIQPHGVLLLLRETDLTVVQASANAPALLGQEVLGRDLAALGGDAAERIAPLLDQPLDALPVPLRCSLGRRGPVFDGLLHRPPGGGLVLELERPGEAPDLTALVERALAAILGTYTLRMLCEETARILRDLLGYDRVMVYRFDEDGHGEVVAEQRRADLEPYLGNRYPAADIPQVARRLYLRNRLRMLVDVQYAPVPLVPRLSPLTGEDLDLSLSVLRSVSPMHVQYMKNMGVTATLVISLLVGGRLWGLIACHHAAPRTVPYPLRAACELLAEAVGTRLAALESFTQAQAELSVRRLEQRMIEAVGREGDWRGALFDQPQTLLQPLNANGAALLFEGRVLSTGEVPGTGALREIGAWLDTQRGAPVIAQAALGLEEPRFAGLAPAAAGLLATPVSESPGEWLVWFRPEQTQTVIWGGDPFKPVVIGDDPTQVSPRRSFAQWCQIVEGRAETWTPTDMATARLIGDTVTDVVLQFRAVRMLIALDQLDQVRRQVGAAGQAAVVADAEGRILLANAAFTRLLPALATGLEDAATGPRWLEELPPHFAERADFAMRLRDVLQTGRSWRGEVHLRTPRGDLPLLVRADAVFSSPDRVLGYVFLFTDLACRKAAEAARRRFQDGILDGHRLRAGPLESKSDLVYRALLQSVLENAQLAALEITAGVEVSRIPEMLEHVRISAARAAQVLEGMIRHAAQGGPAPRPSR
ncbi:GAF domain-containing protein [Paracraurococcus ruber]|uniref:Histidine kinase n=1 Tax=Paracraurococcus ruber TaxID=77675 RepID=A0ABS1CT43_9PROT|nr:GAF domain-containing protein [Paracraurococcus ruber]MBK1657436.1 histidine kinase [Paracraurococcus ruber]TDG33000.1 GAF domain-containing protein [Paracraurococcus ruber]